jgi:hypothetical protein
VAGRAGRRPRLAGAKRERRVSAKVVPALGRVRLEPGLRQRGCAVAVAWRLGLAGGAVFGFAGAAARSSRSLAAARAAGTGAILAPARSAASGFGRGGRVRLQGVLRSLRGVMWSRGARGRGSGRGGVRIRAREVGERTRGELESGLHRWVKNRDPLRSCSGCPAEVARTQIVRWCSREGVLAIMGR